MLPKLDQLPRDEQRSLAEAFLASRAEYLCAGVTDLSKDELQQQAVNEGVEGASSMTKSELQGSIRAAH